MNYEEEAAGEAPIARGNRNLLRVFVWLYMWGWTTEARLQELLGVVRRPCLDLVRRGILVKVASPRGHPGTFSINVLKVSKALEIYEQETGRDAITYPWPRTAVPFATLGEHNDKAQEIALCRFREKGSVLTSGRELQNGGKGAIPDFQINHGSHVEWHEVELTAKYHEALFFQLAEREKARTEGKFTCLVWWCRTQGIARNLLEALCRTRIPQVARRADGKLVRLADVEGWDPAKLRVLCRVRLSSNANGTNSRVERKLTIQPTKLAVPVDPRYEVLEVIDGL